MVSDSVKNQNKATDISKRDTSITPEEVISNRRDRIWQKQSVRAFFVKLIAVGLAIWLIYTYLFGVGIMEGEAMYPRLRDGDLFLYYRLESSYHVSDVVTFSTTDGKQYVGRIVAKGGDTVDMSDAGELMINGNTQSEEIFYPTYKTDAITSFPCTLSETQVFLLCDLRTAGADSRTYGAVETSRLDGKIISILRMRGI